jgi:hypothetical protein
MDQDPIAPQNPQPDTNPTPLPPPPPPPAANTAPIDIGKILLPKKEVHAPENIPRVNAGALLTQEQGATMQPSAKPLPPLTPPKEDSTIAPIETYQGDIEKYVQSKNLSVVSIAAAEATRRAAQPVPETRSSISTILLNIAMVLGGICFILLAGGALYYILQPTPTVQIATVEQAPFIMVDSTKIFSIPSGPIAHLSFLNALAAERDKLKIDPGLIARFNIGVASSTTNGIAPLSTSAFLKLLSPNVPDTLLRALDQKTYLLGVHAYVENQPFIILKADSFDLAYSAMLLWENNMRQDLIPLFNKTPPVHLSAQPLATTSASSTPAIVIRSGFVDTVIDNHDARAVETTQGDILLFWSFIDRNTIVVTTTEATLHEIVKRLRTTPIVPLP